MKCLKTSEGVEFLIDDDDFENISKYRWCIYDRYLESYINGKNIKLSRFIMKADKDHHVDHINGDLLDNRKANLRLCSRYQNQQNRKINKDNVCGHKGIQLMNNGRYRVRIQTNGKREHIGCFERLVDAINCRREIGKESHGKFYREE